MARTKRGLTAHKKKPSELRDDAHVEEQPELGDDAHVEDQQNNAELQSTEQEFDREDEDEPEGEVELSDHDEAGAVRSRKRQRGPTRMKHRAKDPNNKLQVDFTFTGEPYGSGSVKLSSYLSPLVREHVPLTLTIWTKLSEALKTLLWKSVQARFELDEDYQRKTVRKQLGYLWSSDHNNHSFIRPSVIATRKEGVNRFFTLVVVKEWLDLQKKCENPSEVTRLKVWVKSRTRKDGTPVNTNAAEKMKKASEVVLSATPNTDTNEGEDTLTQLLGPDNSGRMRVMDRNMTKTKLACFEVKHKCMTEMQEKQVHLQQKVNELQAEIANLKNQRQEPEVGENSAAKSVNKRSEPKCVLVDWAGTDANVAEGRIISSKPNDLVNGTRLGPTDVKVVVDSATVPDAFLWRPATNMFTMVEAVGQMIAWPASKCVHLKPAKQVVDIIPLTDEPKTLVNGLPLGPKAVKVFIDQVHQPETFIWRSTMETTYIEDCLMSFVAWPATKIVLENSRDGTGYKSPFQNSVSTDQTAGGKSVGTASGSMEMSFKSDATGSKSAAKVSNSANDKSPETYPGVEVIKENQKCKLMDISGRKLVVAEGRVHSTDPEQKVHFVRLGFGAARVWVDIVKVDDAAVWKPSDEIETVKDAHGSSIAWPMDKLVIY
ncbi:unnamed protein product [Microthlaspi erraticum]|uniref:Uncharacterized protein n=1 Tax=Microthlaspi erraticum TaxID=1685480 RepID=A0A6D2IAD8_9BRAS|nr:unnamed protein product [Microthlaspi erraticum]